MSMAEILEQLPRLGRAERHEVWRRLEELELGEIEAAPEMLAAIDAGRRCLREGKAVSVEHARELLYCDIDEARRRVDILRDWHGHRDPKIMRLDDLNPPCIPIAPE